MPKVRPKIAIKIPDIAGIGKYLTEFMYFPTIKLLIGKSEIKNPTGREISIAQKYDIKFRRIEYQAFANMS